MELSKIATEMRNENTMHIDLLPTIDMIKLINSEDKKVADAVEKESEAIARAVDVIADSIRNGGRLIYIGAGTSGRLGILDAVECPPTFSTDDGTVIGIIAGGQNAIFKAVEGAEDSREMGAEDLKAVDFTAKDVLVGIAASGRTPYVLGAIEYAKSLGAHTVGVCCCKGSEVDTSAEIGISPMPGPEVVTGSTRMKSGTAQKMVLNMLSTATMIKLGKVYGNLMVDVKPSNKKLIQRCINIVRTVTDADEDTAKSALEKCDYSPKVAVVMISNGVDADEAGRILDQCGGVVAKAVGLNNQ